MKKAITDAIDLIQAECAESGLAECLFNFIHNHIPYSASGDETDRRNYEIVAQLRLLLPGAGQRWEPSEPHTIVVRVYFADEARHADIAWNEVTRQCLNQLPKDGDTYIATSAEDLRVLRIHEIR